jgi:hypothetical protein
MLVIICEILNFLIFSKRNGSFFKYSSKLIAVLLSTDLKETERNNPGLFCISTSYRVISNFQFFKVNNVFRNSQNGEN